MMLAMDGNCQCDRNARRAYEGLGFGQRALLVENNHTCVYIPVIDIADATPEMYSRDEIDYITNLWI